MNIKSLFGGWDTVLAHLPMFALLLVGVPLLSLLIIKLWLVTSSLITERAREKRLVSPDLDADGIPVFFDNDPDSSDAPKK